MTGACMILTIFFPAWVAEQDGVKYELYPLHFSVTQDGQKSTTYYPYALSAILAVAAATLSFFEIGKYENRMAQIKMGALNSLLMAGSLGSLVYWAVDRIETVQIAGQYGISLWLPAGAMISNMIANRYIRRDEKIVRDADRIR